jgi:hypothetical protein
LQAQPLRQQVAKFWRRSEAFFGATFKAAPVVQETYDFVGIHFDHKEHTVRLADKTAKKIPAVLPTETSVAELQTLVGRLLFGAGVTRTPLGEFYFALKAVRRHFNSVNTGSLSIHAPITLTKGCVAKLQQLRDRVMASVKLHTPSGRTTLKLFTDASLDGWGAVLMSNRGRVLVSGGSWKGADVGKDIAVLELRAVEQGLAAFPGPLGAAEAVTILVDNTSTEASIRRGNCRSEALAQTLASAIPAIRALPGRISVGHVGSAANPADPPSRMDPKQAYAEAAKRALSHSSPPDTSALRWCFATGAGDKVHDLALWQRSWKEDDSLIHSSSLRQSVSGRNRTCNHHARAARAR